MSSIEAGRAHYELSIRDNTRTQIAQAERNLEAFADRVTRRGKSLTLIGAATTGIGVGLLAPLREANNEAGNFNETVNRFNATFGELSGNTRAFARDFSDAANRSEADVLDALSSFQAFFRGLEFGNKEAARLSTSITRLAEDFGSFNNLESDEARGRVLSALSGSAEVLDKFGVNIRVAAIDQEFLRQGLDVTNKTASEQQKVLARLSIIYRSLNRQGAIGDAVKTAGSFVNTQRGVAAALRDVRIAIGQATLPMRTEFNVSLIRGLRVAREFVAGNQELVRTYAAVGAAVAVTGAVLTGAGVSLVIFGTALRGISTSASAAVAPLAAVGTAGANIGTQTAAGAVAGTSAIGRMTQGAVNLLGTFVSIGAAGATGFAAIVRAAVAVGGALGAAGSAAAIFAALLLVARLNADFSGTAQDLSVIGGTLLNVAQSAILVIGTLAEVDSLVRDIARDFAFVGDILGALGIDVLGRQALELVNALARAIKLLVTFGKAVRNGLSPSDALSQAIEEDRVEESKPIEERFKDLAKRSADQVKTVMQQLKEEIGDATADGLGDRGRGAAQAALRSIDGISNNLQAQFSNIGEIVRNSAGQFVDAFGNTDVAKNAREQVAKLKKLYDEAGSVAQFSPLEGVLGNLDEQIKRAQEANDKADKKINQPTPRGTFFGSTAAQEIGDSVLPVKQLVREAEEGNRFAKATLDELKKRPALVF